MIDTITDICKKFRTLGYIIFTSTFVWFTYWIFYDIIIWNKTLGQVNFINYVGAILSVILAFTGHFLGRTSNLEINFKKHMIPSPPLQKFVSMSEKAPIKMVNVAQEKGKMDYNIDDVRERLQKLKAELDKIKNDSN